jgi:Outer membrane protein beta-barrel domain
MKKYLSRFLCLLPILGLSLCLQAQETYEFGGEVAGSFYKGTSVDSGPISGTIGYKPGPGGGFYFGQNMSGHWGGELRYLYARNDLKVTSGGAEATFSGQTHNIGYDVLLHLTHPDARIRPFVAAGIGLKIYQGTGAETTVQPLSNLVILTNTNQTVFAGDFGGGIKIRVGGRLTVRLEVHDYVTEVPDKVFARVPGSHISGNIFHQIVPAIGIGYTF